MFCCIPLAFAIICNYNDDLACTIERLERLLRLLNGMFIDESWLLRRLLSRVQFLANSWQQLMFANICPCNVRVDLIRRIVTEQTHRIEKCILIAMLPVGFVCPSTSKNSANEKDGHFACQGEPVPALEQIHAQAYKTSGMEQIEFERVLNIEICCLIHQIHIFLACDRDCGVMNMCHT